MTNCLLCEIGSWAQLELLNTQIGLAWIFDQIKTGLPTNFPRDFQERPKQTTAEYNKQDATH